MAASTHLQARRRARVSLARRQTRGQTAVPLELRSVGEQLELGLTDGPAVLVSALAAPSPRFRLRSDPADARRTLISGRMSDVCDALDALVLRQGACLN